MAQSSAWSNRSHTFAVPVHIRTSCPLLRERCLDRFQSPIVLVHHGSGNRMPRTVGIWDTRGRPPEEPSLQANNTIMTVPHFQGRNKRSFKANQYVLNLVAVEPNIISEMTTSSCSRLTEEIPAYKYSSLLLYFCHHDRVWTMYGPYSGIPNFRSKRGNRNSLEKSGVVNYHRQNWESSINRDLDKE